METELTKITVEATINAPVEKVWNAWTNPADIMAWNAASPDWHCPQAAGDLRPGGTFSSTMAAKDGSFSFEFGGTYDVVNVNEQLDSTLGDGRRMWVKFTPNGNTTHVTETFEAEGENPIEMQRGGWQAILDNFKKYVESK